MLLSCKSSIVLDQLVRSLIHSKLNCGYGRVQFHFSHVGYPITPLHCLKMTSFFPLNGLGTFVRSLTNTVMFLSRHPSIFYIHVVLITGFAVTADIRKSEAFNSVIQLFCLFGSLRFSMDLGVRPSISVTHIIRVFIEIQFNV